MILRTHAMSLLLFPALLLTASGREADPTEMQEIASNPGPQDRPNILLIIVDDMGFSDIGAFGSEIQTPRLDSLAGEGIKFTNFYNHAKCSPTRGAIQSSVMVQGPRGVDLGSDLTRGLVDAGYAAFGVGKNHGSFGNGPYRMRFSMDGGAANHFNPGVQRPGESEVPARKPGKGTSPSNNWTVDNVSRDVKNGDYIFPADWYSTVSFTDIGIRYLNDHLGPDEPFFMILSYTAPHWPLHALPEDKALFEGAYDEGWDVIRTHRYQRLKKLGFFGEDIPLSPVIPGQRDWEGLSEAAKEDFADRMETHAAMVHRLDLEIGRLIDHLEAMGRLDNTMVVFLSDNGADTRAYSTTTDSSASRPDTTSQTSYVGFGREWANAANSPFRLHKRTLFEGGARAPIFMTWPGLLPEERKGKWNDTLGHVVDLLPTFFDAAGVAIPDDIEGKSLKPVFETGTRSGTEAHAGLGFQYGDYIGYRRGDFKLVSHEGRNWELYNMAIDPAETKDLADVPAYASLVAELETAFDDWATYGGTTTRNFFVGDYDGGADQGAQPVPGGNGEVGLSGTNITYATATDNDSSAAQLSYRGYWSYRDDLETIGDILAWAHPVNSSFRANTASLGGLTSQDDIARGATVHLYVLVEDENANRAAYSRPANWTRPTRGHAPTPGEITAITAQEPESVAVTWTKGADPEDAALDYALIVADRPVNTVEAALTHGRFITGYLPENTAATATRLAAGEHHFSVLVRDSSGNIVITPLADDLDDSSATLSIGAVSTYEAYVSAAGSPDALLDPDGDANQNGLSNFADVALSRDPLAHGGGQPLELLGTDPLSLSFPNGRDQLDARFRIVVNSSLDFINDREMLFDSAMNPWPKDHSIDLPLIENPGTFIRMEIEPQ